nr:hypothetical protein [Tanacetum cinerariifolium]
VDTFYKEFALIQDKERHAIPSDFQDNHPMHMYSKALMKHKDHAELMNMKMDFHRENPNRKFFAQKCNFAYNKLIRFKYMFMEDDRNTEYYEPQQYPVFHLC